VPAVVVVEAKETRPIVQSGAWSGSGREKRGGLL
jgi:hypothetical protein